MSQVTLRKHLEAYESTPQEWKKDHEDAMICFDVQDSLAFGLLLLDQMNKLDESFRLDAFSGKVRRDACDDLFREWEDIYHKWLKASLGHLDIIASLSRRGYSIEGSERFRQAVEEVQKWMTPDNEFFSGSAMIDLRDSAVDAHARGETTEWSSSN
jgi:hypothetical protein